MDTPDLRDLQYFAAVVEHGSLTRAAQALKVSQPTLSHAIGRVEHVLGGPVWERLKNRRAGVVPTELGRHALSRGGRAMRELAALAQDAASLRGLSSGQLCIGTIQSLAATLVPQWVARFSEMHAGIVLDLPLVTSEEAPGLVRKGTIDAAFVIGHGGAEDGLRRMRCSEQELVCVVRADHRLARSGSIALSALAEDKFVLVPSGTFAAIAIEDVCRRAGFVPNVRCRLASISGLCALVRAGVGVTVLPFGSISPEDRQLVALRIQRRAPRRAVHLLYRADAEPSPALAAWLETGRVLVGAAKG